MKIHTISLLILSALFLSACQPEVAPTEPAEVVAEAQQTPVQPAEPVIPEEPRFVCFLDEINAVAAMAETEFLNTDMPVVRGWTGFMNGNGTSPGNFEIILSSAEQNFNFPSVAGVARQDVADSQAKPGLINSGYETSMSLKDVKPGKYEITMSTQLNGQNFVCTTGKFIVVK